MNKQLISIAVVTYNSSQMVIDTLESVKAQTYSAIELIVSDDCSTDNTLIVVREWIAKNKDRFVDVKLLSSDENKGIAPNRNKCVREASGEWIKFLDSDDLLTSQAIESYASAINEKIHFIIGNYIPFNEEGEKTIEKNRITLPTLILRKKTFEQLGGFDERFPMLEDYPFFHKAKKAGYIFDWIDEPIVYYRMHLGSIQLTPRFHLSHVNYINQVIVPDYLKEKKYIDYWHDKLWSEKELAKINNQPVKVFFIYLLMLISDTKEWYYIMRDKIYRLIVLKWRG